MPVEDGGLRRPRAPARGDQPGQGQCLGEDADRVERKIRYVLVWLHALVVLRRHWSCCSRSLSLAPLWVHARGVVRSPSHVPHIRHIRRLRGALDAVVWHAPDPLPQLLQAGGHDALDVLERGRRWRIIRAQRCAQGEVVVQHMMSELHIPEGQRTLLKVGDRAARPDEDNLDVPDDLLHAALVEVFENHRRTVVDKGDDMAT